jgi:bacterioferritin
MTLNPMTDIKTLRERARKNIEDGAVTDNYRGDRTSIISLFNDALATELVCVLRYKRHFFTAIGLSAKSVAAEFAEHATEESQHADMLAARIVQLGGEPDFNPDTLTKRSHAEYKEGITLSDMIKEDLIAERIAVESYGEMIMHIGDKDPTSRRVLEQILAQEEEHAEDLASLLKHLVHESKPAQPTKSQSARMGT